MLWILLLSLLLLAWLLLASDTFIWAKASLFSLLLLALSAWWLIDQLPGYGLNAATLYHLGADMEGAGVADFKRVITGFVVLALASLLPLFATRIRRWRRPGPWRGVVCWLRLRVAGGDRGQPARP
ncbi:MAG: Phosphoglycerol transferase I [Stenotrophomonas maltophilia]|uniref:Phosphoglycerol transferase I n=1 Tax=Stenotrophomonas maltophilia TaxID=40324 RepID=A0A7V8FGL7_STEMA|nr:MAG: Phosphoglycerol transferase I [Stenotrophomonas maltophilia]